ncbi:MAG: murein biosynthesis integral membrane protein MurJ, partial [Gammaproteobacteria bacterium]|nr:murein biosynthesis integral membrane protein MurJ [Gammaproteobacteria bacterium]
ALATICGAFVTAGLLYRGLRIQQVYMPQQGWLKFAVQLLSAAAAMAVFILLLKPDLAWWIEAALIDRVTWLFGIIVPAAVIYFAVLVLLGIRPRQLLAARA